MIEAGDEATTSASACIIALPLASGLQVDHSSTDIFDLIEAVVFEMLEALLPLETLDLSEASLLLLLIVLDSSSGVVISVKITWGGGVCGLACWKARTKLGLLAAWTFMFLVSKGLLL